MSRYIDADAFIDDLYEHEFSNWCDKDEVSTLVNDAPSIDICFCRECKKSHIDGKTTHYLWCTEWGRSTDVFGYCERGEREGE